MNDRRRRWSIVRVAWWLVMLAAMALVLASLPGYPAFFTAKSQLDIATHLVLAGSIAGIVISIGTALVSLGLGGLLFARRRREPMALFISFFLIVYGSVMAGPLEVLEASLGDGRNLSAYAQMILLITPTLSLFCLFPNGRFVPRWTRWIIPASLLLLPPVMISSPQDVYAFRTAPLQIMGLGLGILTATGLAAQVYRYRHVSNGFERQQTRAVVFGFLLEMALIAADGVPFSYLQNANPKPWWSPLSNAAWFVTLSILPFSLAFAVLRYRLFDVDVIIRRTLIYSLVTALLLAGYLADVTILQALFTALTGQRSELAIILSTLMIAALFVPIRRRIQRGLDRRFYRSKYDAAQVLEGFAGTARDEVDLSRLTDSLMSVVDQTMQPESVSMWLRKNR